MNLTPDEAVSLASQVAEGAHEIDAVDVAIFPPHPYLASVAAIVAESRVWVGGQDVSAEASGAFTGQVSAAMLAQSGCSMTLVGHSERRHGLRESDDLLAAKTLAAVSSGLRVLLCVGETLAQREAGETFDVVREQVVAGLSRLPAGGVEHVDLAYEPVWAIGTGKTAGPQEAQEVHAALRSEIEARYDARSAAAIRILYGGSVKPSNAAELMACEDVDGGLIGGASLQADAFLDIVRASVPREHS